jgi:hypothetical protein
MTRPTSDHGVAPDLAELLHDLTLDNAWTDAEAGSLFHDGHWYGLIHVTSDEQVMPGDGTGRFAGQVVPAGTYIVHQDAVANSFIYTRYAPHSPAALAAWAAIQRRYPDGEASGR